MIDETFNLRYRMTRWGPMVYPAAGMWIEESLEQYGEYNPVQTAVLRKCIGRSECVIDVGANIGALTVPMAQCAGHVIAYEAQPFLAKILDINTYLNQSSVEGWNVTVCNKAVGAKTGTIKIPHINYNERGNFGGVGQRFWNSIPAAAETIDVEQIALDNVPRLCVGFVKIDVEGMELDVLQGAEKLIAKFRPGILMEADNPEKAPATLQWLLDHDYTPRWCVTRLYDPSNFDNNPDTSFVQKLDNGDFANICSFDVLAYPRDAECPIANLTVASPNDPIGTTIPGVKILEMEDVNGN